MDILIRDQDANSVACDVLILPVFEGQGVAAYKDKTGLLSGLTTGKSKFAGRHGEVLRSRSCGAIKANEVLLVGLGKKEKCSTERVRQAGGKASTALKQISEAALSTAVLNDIEDGARAFSEGFLLARYSFDRYKKKPDDAVQFKALTVLTRKAEWTKEVKTLVDATHFCRDLVTTPARDMTPSELAKVARSIKGVKVKVFGRRECERMGMGAFCAVAKGSHEEPQFIVIEYKGAKKKGKQPIVLVGKSVTFDSGGLSLKPSDSMETMKHDMAGGAAVLGVVKSVIALKLPIDLVVIMAATENLPGGSATRPGDVVRAITGKSIEILNTDAEGRLTLVDALGYAIKTYKPRAIIDIATLTGACAIALGAEASALLGNDEKLQATLEAASDTTGERVWRMPFFEEYDEGLKSDIADLRNIGMGRQGGLITATKFMNAFVDEGTPWAHLDIAGTAWSERDRPYAPKGATGVGVRLLYDVLKRLA